MYHDIVLLGVVVSLILTELTGLSPAGLIVPGYLVLCLQTPQRIVYTLAVVLLTMGAARLLNTVTILYGRRQFAVMVLLSFAIHFAVMQTRLLPYDPGMIGTLVPGIMANEFTRQGIFKSLLALIFVTGLLALVLLFNGTGVLPL